MKTPIQSGLYSIACTIPNLGTLNGHLTITTAGAQCTLSGGDNVSAWFGDAVTIDDNVFIVLETQRAKVSPVIIKKVRITLDHEDIADLNLGSGTFFGYAETTLQDEELPVVISVSRVRSTVL